MGGTLDVDSPGSTHGYIGLHIPLLEKDESMIPFIVAAVMLYGPYGWCFYRKEPLEKYSLVWRLDMRSVIEVSLALAMTLVPLTFLSVNWPGQHLPRTVSLETFLYLGTAGTVAAAVEEVFFRGWTQNLMLRFIGPYKSIILTSALFSLCHLFLKIHWLRLATFFPGIVMGILSYRHRSVAPSAIYHLGGNLWAIWFFPYMP